MTTGGQKGSGTREKQFLPLPLATHVSSRRMMPTNSMVQGITEPGAEYIEGNDEVRTKREK